MIDVVLLAVGFGVVTVMVSAICLTGYICIPSTTLSTDTSSINKEEEYYQYLKRHNQQSISTKASIILIIEFYIKLIDRNNVRSSIHLFFYFNYFTLHSEIY
ncbi:unnamed protein product [Adineta steineri]|uniref:Uncharacterized protein n=1 Tax=Adineta steineri TaxID=433720 RepID=A0A815KUG8_9BILA|nr:unnamed protein product [Adineta steineri]